MPKKAYEIIKVFNNNAVLVEADGEEKILYGKGIGFGKKTGRKLEDGAVIEKIYSVDKQSFHLLAQQTEDYIIGASEDMIFRVEQALGEELNAKVHTSLIDHIAFMVKRLQNGEEILNPFLVQTEILYQEEFTIARQAISALEKALKLKIPEGEIAFIALHIHSSRAQNQLSSTIRHAFVINTLTEFIEDELHFEIDKKSLDYIRFVTHLRFTIQRLTNGEPVENILLEQVKAAYADSFALATRMGGIIREELHLIAEEAEIGYLAVYIERLKRVAGQGQKPSFS